MWIKCRVCDGIGQMLNRLTGSRTKCTTCGGAGVVQR